jgi:dTDP-4-dehydrorhamnose reductase
MRVVDDQIGTPTRALHLAEALWHIVDRPAITGLLHFTDSGVASWYDVAVTVLETMREADKLGAGATVLPARSDEFPRPARRPLYSVLDKHASWQAIGYTPPHWRHGVVASTLELLHA